MMTVPLHPAPDREARAARRLPARLSSFIGRETQLPETRRVLDETRLLTLTGPGGVGKTRFAARLAELVQARYADGARWADLSAVHDPALTVTAVAAALCLRAWLAWLRGDARAAALSAESVACLRGRDVPVELGLALLIHTGLAATAGDRDRDTRLALTREALALAEEIAYEALAGSLLMRLAEEQRRAGDLAGAAGCIQRALALLPVNDPFTLWRTPPAARSPSSTRSATRSAWGGWC